MSRDLPDGVNPLPPDKQQLIQDAINRIPRLLALYPPPWALGLSPEGDGFIFCDRNHTPIPVVLPMKFLVFGLAVLFGINSSKIETPRDKVFPPRGVLRHKAEGYPQNRTEWRALASEVFYESGTLPGEDAWFAWLREHKFLDMGANLEAPPPRPTVDPGPAPGPEITLNLGDLLSQLGLTGPPPPTTHDKETS